MASWLDDLLGKTIMNGAAVLPDRKILRFITTDGATVDVADNPSTGSGIGSTDVTIGAGAPASTVIVDQSPTQDDNGATYNNVGAPGQVTINLPATPNVGTVFRLRVADAQYLKFKANTGQTIQLDSLVSASAGYVRSNYQGAALTIEAVSSTRWFCSAIQGPWDLDS